MALILADEIAGSTPSHAIDFDNVNGLTADAQRDEITASSLLP
jgi:hypothetical protein